MAFDRSKAADLLALKTEVNDDPLGLGYNAALGDTGLILGTLNAKSTDFTVSKPKISAAEIRSLIKDAITSVTLVYEVEFEEIG